MDCLYIAAQVLSYFWHRYGAHEGYLPIVQSIHTHHHTDVEDQTAGPDFILVLLVLTFFIVLGGAGVSIGLLPPVLTLVTIAILLVVFWWNWWIHQAYHHPNHWLNAYAWFLREKDTHMIHHTLHDKNYAITFHPIDRLLGSWVPPLSVIK